jgi:hypothetical protein
MSWDDIFSYWRCPNCRQENVYNLTWQYFYEFKEVPNESYSKEKCNHCGKEYYVSDTEPNPYCFRMNRGKCKNDYIRDLVLDVNEKLTIVNEYATI